MEKNTGKVREFCQPGKVGTLVGCANSLVNTAIAKPFGIAVAKGSVNGVVVYYRLIISPHVWAKGFDIYQMTGLCVKNY